MLNALCFYDFTEFVLKFTDSVKQFEFNDLVYNTYLTGSEICKKNVYFLLFEILLKH